jgi:hypothetical protein
LLLQATDQQWIKGNLALKQNFEKEIPVRMFRGKVGAEGQRMYVYEGLYKVVEAKQENSKDGPLVGSWSHSRDYGWRTAVWKVLSQLACDGTVWLGSKTARLFHFRKIGY